MAKCVVATSSQGLPDCLINGATGVVVSHDQDELADTLERLFRDRPLADELGQRGRELVQKQCNIDRFAASVCSFLEACRSRGMS